MAGQYPMENYAEVLCDAVKAYDYPAITYNFEPERELLYQKLLSRVLGGNFDRKVTLDHDPDRRTCHPHIRDVENHIGKQLNQVSQGGLDIVDVNRKDAKLTQEELIELIATMAEVVDGLSNVLYWGHANADYRWTRVQNFRESVNIAQIIQFSRAVNGLLDPGLVRIKKIGMSEFGYMSFVSKVRMFLDPDNYPVLDRRIANFVIEPATHFPPLQNIKSKSSNVIDITGPKEQKYMNWALWCRGIADIVKPLSSSKLRAVDVERGIFQFVGSKKDPIPHYQREKNHAVARQLLNCPEGWTPEKVIRHAQQLKTKN